MDISDLPMSSFIYIGKEVFHALCIVRHDGDAIVEKVIDRHYRNVAFYKFYHFRVVKIDTGDHHAIKSTVSGMFQIGHAVGTGLATVDKSHIIALLLRYLLETVKHM